MSDAEMNTDERDSETKTMSMAQETPELATGESLVSGAKKQATVPQEIREAIGIDTGDRLKWVYQNGELKVYVKQ